MGEVFTICAPISAPASSFNAGLRARTVPGSASGVVWLDIYLQAGADCGGNTLVGTNNYPNRIAASADWSTLAFPQVNGVPGAVSAIYELHLLKTDQTSAAFDVELDMAYLAPSPSVGWH